MATPAEILQQRDSSSGVIQGVSSFISPRNSIKHSRNFVFDKEYGDAVLRDGSTIIGSQLVAENNSILGLYNFRHRSGSNHALIAAVNLAGDGSSTQFIVTDGSSSLAGDSPNLVPRYETFLDRVVRVNGTDAVKSWGGSGSWSTGGDALDVGSMPNGVDVIAYKDRLAVLNEQGILYRSGLPSSPSFSSISWTSGDQEIAVDPDNTSYAGKGVGLARVSGLLLIFKERALYSFNGSAVQPDFLYDVGCSSVRSIGTGGGLVFFFNPDGIWVTKGGDPVRISRPVQKYIDGMSSANFSSVAGFANGKYYWCSIGNTTVEGTTYTNVVLRYTIDTKEWAILSYATRPTVFTRYINGTDVSVVYGDDTARVYTLDSGLTDNGTPITFEYITHDLEFGSRGTTKEIHNKLMVYGEDMPEAIVQVKVERDDWLTVGTVSAVVSEVTLSEILRGHYFRVRLVGSSSSTPLTFKGFEVPFVTHLSYGV